MVMLTVLDIQTAAERVETFCLLNQIFKKDREKTLEEWSQNRQSRIVHFLPSGNSGILLLARRRHEMARRRRYQRNVRVKIVHAKQKFRLSGGHFQHMVLTLTPR